MAVIIVSNYMSIITAKATLLLLLVLLVMFLSFSTTAATKSALNNIQIRSKRDSDTSASDDAHNHKSSSSQDSVKDHSRADALPSPENGNNEKTETQKNNDDDEAKQINCSLPINSNNTRCIVGQKNELSKIESFGQSVLENKGALLRTLYVTLGVTGIVVIYFIVRAALLRRNRTKSRKYGIIAQNGDRGDMEMEPLGDGNEDDEDYTVFEMKGRKK